MIPDVVRPYQNAPRQHDLQAANPAPWSDRHEHGMKLTIMRRGNVGICAAVAG
jgi:hypothetical protein